MYQDLNKSTAGANSCSAMEPETIQKNGVSPKDLKTRSRGNFFALLLSIGFAIVVFNSCDEIEKENDTIEETLACEDIHPSASTFTTIDVRIEYTSADGRYESLKFFTRSVVDDKHFCVAESQKNSKEQTFTFKDVPNEYLEKLIIDEYSFVNMGYIHTTYNYFPLIEGNAYRGFTEDELQRINISNINTKIAMVFYGSVMITAIGQMTGDDGTISRVGAEMNPSDKMECLFNRWGSYLVYSDSDCDITGRYGDLNLEIHLRKGWNKVFAFEDRIITTDDIKDSHLTWYQSAG
jgi:hypothetical protein